MNKGLHVLAGMCLALFAFCCGLHAAGLTEVHSWGYQLDRIDPREIAASPFDLVVVDYSRDGSQEGAFSPRDVQIMQRKPDGGRRIVVAYFSIGEAEDYRFYWNSTWKNRPPSWLDAENSEWPGNYKVKFWEEGWHHILFGSPDAYLDRILAAGFDGAYLDIIDAFEYYQDRFPDAAQRMAELIKQIAGYARARHKGFLIIAQNGESLVANPLFLDAIDGLSKEDLFYGMEEEGQKNLPAEIRYSLDFLEQVKKAGKPVFVVTYVSNAQQKEEVFSESLRHGFLPYAAVRQLDRLLTDQSTGAGNEVESPARLFTPGGSRNGTLEKGEMRVGVGYSFSREESTYEEYEDPGVLAYRDRTRDEETTITLRTTLGLGWGFEGGIGLSGVSAVEKYREEVGGNLATREQDEGLQQIRFYAAQCTTFADDAASIQTEAEFGLPTFADDRLYSEGADANITLTAEYFPDRLGIIGRLGGDWLAGEDFADWHDSFSYSGGLGFNFSGKLDANLLVGKNADNTELEASAEYLLTPLSSLEANFIRSIAGEHDYWTLQIQYNLVFR